MHVRMNCKYAWCQRHSEAKFIVFQVTMNHMHAYALFMHPCASKCIRLAISETVFASAFGVCPQQIQISVL